GRALRVRFDGFTQVEFPQFIDYSSACMDIPECDRIILRQFLRQLQARVDDVCVLEVRVQSDDIDYAAWRWIDVREDRRERRRPGTRWRVRVRGDRAVIKQGVEPSIRRRGLVEN